MTALLKRWQKHDGHLTDVEVQELGLLVRDVARDVAPDAAVPQESVVFLLEVLLHLGRDLLLVRLRTHGNLRDRDDLVLQLLVHRRRLDHGLHLSPHRV